MSQSGIEAIDRTIHKTNEWLGAVVRCAPELDRHHAYAALRAVLHALRDRLPVEAAANFGAQLPTLVRGIYYEGWHPAGKPLRLRHFDEFLALIEQELPPGPHRDPENAARAVFRVIEQHVDPGETDKVIRMLPTELQELWGPPVEPRDS
jgi:uncharacterized protein (DUF2267 family)